MNKSIIQNALGDQWEKLPESLKNHYRENSEGENYAEGWLDVDYPWFMQWPLSFLGLFGVLINKRGKAMPSKVHRSVKQNRQYWYREIELPNKKIKMFNSQVVSNGGNDVIEYPNAFLGMKMSPFVKGDKLRYESKGYVIKLGQFKIPFPEWLALGHASILEEQVSQDDKKTFKMDFRLKHPLFGELFCYKGVFKTHVN